MEQELKARIEEKMQKMELDEVEDMLSCYKKEHPHDRDLLSYRTILCLFNNELEKAYEYACQGIRRYPTSAEMYYIQVLYVRKEMM